MRTFTRVQIIKANRFEPCDGLAAFLMNPKRAELAHARARRAGQF
jgi:hypothetical protein